MVHIPVVKTIAQVQLVALAEADMASADLPSMNVSSAKYYDDWQLLLDDAKLDAVVITLPTALHVEAASAAFRRGLHVYLEKPLSDNCNNTRELIRCWRKSGKIGMVGFNFRFNPLFEKARKMLTEGRIGKILGTRSVFTSRGPVLAEWKKHRKSGGGALLDLSSHHFDLLPWLLGRNPASVACNLSSVQTEDDTSNVQMTYEDGVVSHIFTSINASEEHRLEITGTDGTMLIDLNRSDRVEILGATLDRARLLKLTAATHAFGNPAYWRSKFKAGVGEVSFERLLSAFCQAALRDQQIHPDLIDGYRSLSIVEAAEESARTGCQITIKTQVDEDITG